jgi:predicted nucleic acid-binding protein
MTDYVTDSSVVVKWFIEEDHSDHAQRLFQLKLNKEAELWAPDLLLAEFGNVMWKYYRRGSLNEEQVQQNIEDLKKLKLQLVSIVDLVSEAVKLAVAHDLTVYDALYLALSIQLDCPFITADERLYNAVRSSMPQTQLLATGTQ